LRPREVDVNALIIETARFLRPSLGKHIEIESIFDDRAWHALVDPAQLATALLNLAVNARDAMPGGGKLVFKTGNVMYSDVFAAQRHDLTVGPYVLIVISDAGTGIPIAIRDKVFDPFFTTKETGKGTGLGLSIVYGFVKQSGGHVSIDSEEGRGASIRIFSFRRVGGYRQRRATR
jgi:signal transduction histidine kinase